MRGWIRGARRSAAELRVTGIRVVVAYDQVRCRPGPPEASCAARWSAWAAAAMVVCRRFGLKHVSPWARINVLTRGPLLAMAPAG